MKSNEGEALKAQAFGWIDISSRDGIGFAVMKCIPASHAI
jgi:hypothetical protein